MQLCRGDVPAIDHAMKAHPFLAHTDWRALEARRTAALWVPPPGGGHEAAGRAAEPRGWGLWAATAHGVTETAAMAAFREWE